MTTARTSMGTNYENNFASDPLGISLPAESKDYGEIRSAIKNFTEADVR